MSILKKLMSVQIFALAAVGTIIWQAYDRYGPQMPDISDAKKRMANQVIEMILTDIPDLPNIKKIFIFKFAGDDSEYFTDNLRKRIGESSQYQVIPKSLVEKIKDDLRLPEKAISNLEDAVATGKELGADAVAFGRINVFHESKIGAHLDTVFRLAEIETSRVVFFKNYNNGLTTNDMKIYEYRKNIQESSLVTRLFYWVLFTGIIPLTTVGFIKMVVIKESNRANFFLLTGYTILSFLFALAMVGFSIKGINIPIFLILALISSIIFYIWFFGLIYRLSK